MLWPYIAHKGECDNVGSKSHGFFWSSGSILNAPQPLPIMLSSPLRRSLPFEFSRVFNPTVHGQGGGSCILKN